MLTTRDLLAALQLPGVGPSTVRKLYDLAASPSLPNGGDLAGYLARLPNRRAPPASPSDLDNAFADADHLIDQSRKRDIVVLSPFDVPYPRALLDIADFPPILYVRGSLATLANPKKLAVVGTRHPSDLGLRLAKKIAAELSNLGVCVVSGLALGIDAAAHQGAVKGRGSTIAVLAHGLDQIAPKSNEPLAASILEHGGALVSEYEIGVTPRPQQFVFRNRLQSGLSRGSVVVESGYSGGSIHQGKFTTEQHRFLFVVTPEEALPGASEFKRAGAERLRAEFKARAVIRFEDILEIVPDFRSSPTESVTPEAAPVVAKKSDGAKPQGSLFD